MPAQDTLSPVMQILGAVLFGLALLHTFAAKAFEVLAHRHPSHAGRPEGS